MAGKKNPDPIVIVMANNEQRELDFSPYAAYGIVAENGKLRSGDYAVRGYENHMFIERKSLNDLVKTLTYDRERFLREIYDRGSFVPCKHLVVEAPWQDISREYSFSKTNPTSIVNTLFSLMMPPTQIHVHVGSRAMCAWYVANVCLNFVRRVTHGSRGLWNAVNAPDAADLAPLPCPYRQIGE